MFCPTKKVLRAIRYYPVKKGPTKIGLVLNEGEPVHQNLRQVKQRFSRYKGTWNDAQEKEHQEENSFVLGTPNASGYEYWQKNTFLLVLFLTLPAFHFRGRKNEYSAQRGWRPLAYRYHSPNHRIYRKESKTKKWSSLNGAVNRKVTSRKEEDDYALLPTTWLQWHTVTFMLSYC